MYIEIKKETYAVCPKCRKKFMDPAPHSECPCGWSVFTSNLKPKLKVITYMARVQKKVKFY
jgi:hypothetical protein